MSTSKWVAGYLERIAQATSLKQQRVRDDLLLYYDQLSEEQRDRARPQMEMVLEEVSQEVAASDSLLQRARQVVEQ